MGHDSLAWKDKHFRNFRKIDGNLELTKH